MHQNELNTFVEPLSFQLSHDPNCAAAQRRFKSPSQCVQNNGRPLSPTDPMPCPGFVGKQEEKTPFYSITRAAPGHQANTKESGFIKTISAKSKPNRLIYLRLFGEWDREQEYECSIWVFKRKILLQYIYPYLLIFQKFPNDAQKLH